MMITPGSNDTTSLFNLLSIISDPVAAKQNLTDIAKASSDLDDKLIAFQDLSAQQTRLFQDQDAVEKKKADISVELDSLSTSKAELAAEKTDFSNKVIAFNNQVSQTTSDLNQRQSDLDAREAAVSSREAVVENNVAKTANELSQAQALKQSIQDKLNQMKAIV